VKALRGAGLFLLAIAAVVGLPRAARAAFPRGEVISPAWLFTGKDAIDDVVRESNPRVYLHRDFDPGADLILVVGMPGLGGRSENFIGCLYSGLRAPGLTRRLVLAVIQDPVTRGPIYQGQHTHGHANVWRIDDAAVAALRRFVERMAAELGHLRVYFMGYSTGSVSAPIVAARVAALGPSARFVVEGSISLGTGSGVRAEQLRSQRLRSIFVVAPPRRPAERRAYRYDQKNRGDAEADVARLTAEGASVALRHVESARRHDDWHWGLMSQCRYHRRGRPDDGPGAWPNYWMPNPESYGYISAFIAGGPVPEKLSPPPTRCPRPPNVHDPSDPDAQVDDPGRQAGWAPGTVPPGMKEPN
jgi:hypothetical protein